jgi:preprotein translocase subunit SecA
MGAIADAMFRYAQPLIDATDGSPEQVQKAFTLSQMCWNLAVTPETERDASLASMQPALRMDDEEFREFQRDIVRPMIRRHQEMFPAMQGPAGSYPSQHAPSRGTPQPAARRSVKKYPGTGRNERCPCGSGRKYKICCGR